MLIFRIHQYGFCLQGTLIIKPMTTKRVFRDRKSFSFDHYSGQISLRHILLREQMLEIRNFAENETERKFLLEQLVTRGAVLPSWPKSNLPVFPVAPVWPKSNLPVFPAAHLSKASENLTSLNKNGTLFKGWSKLLQD